MMFMNVIGCSSKLPWGLSKKKKDQHRKRKRLNTSSGNSFQQQRRSTSLHPPSIMVMSDLSRSISNRSITFASVFDEPDNRTNFDPDLSMENEDLVIVVPNKYVLNEPIVNTSNTEPYPFRSEVPLSILPKSQSSTTINRSVHSKRKFLHRRTKKHKTIPSIDRSNSVPNLIFASSSSTTTKTNDHNRSLKTIRQWFKSSSVGRLIRSFIRHSTENTKHLKEDSISSQKSTDLIY